MTKTQLTAGTGIFSPDLKYKAYMDWNGNFVIAYYNNLTKTWDQKWQTNTHVPNSKIVMQDDGNLVIYSPDGKALWASNSNYGSGKDFFLKLYVIFCYNTLVGVRMVLFI